MIIDDYGLPTGCREAVDAFRAREGVNEPLVRINSQAVYWRRA